MNSPVGGERRHFLIMGGDGFVRKKVDESRESIYSWWIKGYVASLRERYEVNVTKNLTWSWNMPDFGDGCSVGSRF
jgi:hypothetical protein